MSSRGKKKASRIDGSKSASATKVPTKKKISPKKKWTLMVLSFLLGICLVLGIADLVVSWSVVHTLIHPEKIGWSDSPMSVRLSYDAFELETANGMVYGWVLPAQDPFDEDAEDWIPTEEYSDKTIVFAPTTTAVGTLWTWVVWNILWSSAKQGTMWSPLTGREADIPMAMKMHFCWISPRS